MTFNSTKRLQLLLGSLLLVLVITGCGIMADSEDARVEQVGGDIERGQELVNTNGCLMCHSVSGESSVANGYGPDLDGFAENRLIAGEAANTPDNLIQFLLSPQSVVPGTGMPNTGLTEDEARDIASWLYSLDDD